MACSVTLFERLFELKDEASRYIHFALSLALLVYVLQ